MKTKMISIAIALIGFVTNINGQPTRLSEPPEYKPLKETKLFSGKVMGWVSDQNFFYNGFLLENESERFLVKFSSRLGNQLTSALKIGVDVSLNGIEIPDSTERNVVRLVTIKANGLTIYDSGPAVNTPAEEAIYGSSTIAWLQKNELGQIIGIILYDKTILRLTLDAAEQLTSIAVVGAFVSYSGNQIPRAGEFSPEHCTIVQCRTITIDNKQYLIE